MRLISHYYIIQDLTKYINPPVRNSTDGESMFRKKKMKYPHSTPKNKHPQGKERGEKNRSLSDLYFD